MWPARPLEGRVPNQPQPEAPASVAQTVQDPHDEIYDAVPAEATAFVHLTHHADQEVLIADADVCYFAKSEFRDVRGSQAPGFHGKVRQQITACLRRAVLSCRASAIPKLRPRTPNPVPEPPAPVTMTCSEPCRPLTQHPPADRPELSEIPERGHDQVCSATAASTRIEAILDTGASRCVIGDRLLQQLSEPKFGSPQVLSSLGLGIKGP